MSRALLVLVCVLLVFTGCWLLLLAADAGGWVRFGAALVVCAVALVVLPKELRDDHIIDRDR